MLLLSSDNKIPLDCLILATSEEEGLCYVQTTNLDGETNLKPKAAVADLGNLIDDAQIAGRRSGSGPGRHILAGL